MTGAVVIVTVAALDSVVPSVAAYEKASIPLKFGAGVYTKLPSALNVNVPCCGPDASTAVSVPASTSVSFTRTPGAATVNG